MLLALSALVILAVGYAQMRNGLFTAVAMAVQVVLAGLVAFGFWEPLADALDSGLRNSALAGCEDLIVLTGLFCVTLTVLRIVTNRLNPDMIEHHGYVQHLGAGAVGLVTGYLVSGFLVCAMQTLPVEANFLGFEPRTSEEESILRAVLPADRVWLALMRHAGAYPFSNVEDNPDAEARPDRFVTFDRGGTFELRHLRHRRYSEGRGPLPYQGEFDQDLHRKR